MGWNGIRVSKRHPVLDEITAHDEFYFVHGYYLLPAFYKNVLRTTSHGIELPSVIGHNSLIAVQFHPEKGGKAGLKILQKFCTWDGHYAE